MSLTSLIGGVSYGVVPGSLKVTHQVDQQDGCSFDVIELTGAVVFAKYQPVVLTDSTLGALFTGVVWKPDMNLLWPNPGKRWTITCTDQTYRLSKRTSNKIYTNQQAGVIAADQIQRYGTADHVSGAFALDWRELQTEWQGGTVSGTVVATNASSGNPGDGDVELASAGSQVVATGSSTTFTQHNGLKLTGYCSSGYSTAYTYQQIWSGSQTVHAGGGGLYDSASYDMWISSSSPQIKCGIDFVCSDGTTFSSTTQFDFEGMSIAPSTDLSGLANDQWYSRQMLIDVGSLDGKTLVGIYVALAGTSQGTYTAYFRRISYSVAGGSTINVFGDASTLSTNVQQLNLGYSAVSLIQVSLSDKSTVQTHSALSISAASIVRNSQIAWNQTIPSGVTALRETSIDGGATWQPATSGSAIPNLLAGMAVSGRTVATRDTLTLSTDPTVVCSLAAPTVTVNPSYASSKTDVITSYTTATNFNTGTLTNLKTVGSSGTQGITLNGAHATFDYSNQFPSMAFYGGGGNGYDSLNKQLRMTTGANSETRARLDFVGQFADFTAEVDVIVVGTGNTAGGFVYRTPTANWQNTNDTYAYIAMLSQTTLVLGRGTNTGSGGGAFTGIQTATVALTANSMHRLKIVISGTSHQLFVDGVRLINTTDGTYTAAGNLGLRATNATGATISAGMFDNVGVVAALSGTWQSPAISLTSATTYGASSIFWDIDGIPDSTCSITGQTSIDSGSTWQSVTNGGAISGLTTGTSLSGKTVILLLTLTASNAPVVPTLNGVTAWVEGQYSSSGTWGNGPLGNDSFVRANVAGSWGTSTDGQTWTRAAGTDTPSVSGNKGIITTNASATPTRMILGSQTATDCDGLVRITVGSTSDAAGIILRSDAAGLNHYTCRSNSTTQFVIFKRVAGSATNLVTITSGITIANGSIFWMRFRAQGTTLSAKMWIDGTAEPATFAGSTTDATFASGQFGLFCSAAPTSPESFGSFKVTRYPNPVLSLASVGRAAYALANWNALLPANTALIVAASTDNSNTYQTVGSAGGAIPGINTVNHQTAVLQSKPSAFYHLGETSGTTANDVTGAYNATYSGTGVTYSQAGALWGPDESATTGVLLDGAAGHITCPSGLNPAGAAFSIIGWVKPTSNTQSGYNRIASNADTGGSNTGFDLMITPTNNLGLSIANGSSSVGTFGPSVLSNANWHHIAGTYDASAGSGNIKIYVDGVLDNTGTQTGNIAAAAYNIAIGYDPAYTGGYFPGDVDEFSIYIGRAVTSAEIMNHYLAGRTSPTDTAADTFATNTSSSYTQIGSATWTWDTANSRLTGSGGTNAALIYNTLSAQDSQVTVDLDQADGAGIYACYSTAAGANAYKVVVADASATGMTANTLQLYKIVNGVSTQFGTTATISFPRGTHHYFSLLVQSGIITASMDGVAQVTYTDNTPLGAGQFGLLLNTLVRCYELIIKIIGRNVSAATIATKMTLSSTDATVTPQVLDLETFAGATSFGSGSLVATANYNAATSYLSSNLDDLKNKSTAYWWSIAHVVDSNGNYPVTFQPRTATPALWPLDEANSQTIAGQSVGDLMLNGIKVSYSADLYRNRQTLKNAIATATFTQTFHGDGQTRTWNVANPLSSPPTTWTLNGLAVTIGISGVDSGKNFYYQIGSTALTQDSGGTILQATDSFTIVYVGSYRQDVTYDNTALAGTLTQSALAAITGDSGIVESVIDVASENMSVAAATAYAQQLCQQYGVAGLTFPFISLRAGLAIGQQLAIYAPDLSINDLQAFISGVTITQQLAPAVAGGILYGFAITVCTGPALPASSWVKLLASGLGN